MYINIACFEVKAILACLSDERTGQYEARWDLSQQQQRQGDLEELLNEAPLDIEVTIVALKYT